MSRTRSSESAIDQSCEETGNLGRKRCRGTIVGDEDVVDMRPGCLEYLGKDTWPEEIPDWVAKDDKS